MHLNITRLCNWIILSWIVVVSICLTIILKSTSLQTTYFQFGPNESFLVFGIRIDTYSRYVLLCIYSILNAGIRALHHNVVHPWILHNVQDSSIEKKAHYHVYAYQFTMVSIGYTWFDWFIYMNILLSQVDMLIMELSADALVTMATTYMYLNPDKITHRLPFTKHSLELETQPMRQDIPAFS